MKTQLLPRRRDSRFHVIGGICALAALLLQFGGCDRSRGVDSGSFTTRKPALVIWVSPTANESGWSAVRSAAQASAADLGNIRLEFIAPPGPSSAAALLEGIRDAVLRKPDAICLWVIDGELDAAAVRLAVSSGALVVTLGAQSEEPGVYAHIDCGASAAGDLLGRGLANLPEQIRTYSLIHEATRGRAAKDCYEHFELSARSSANLTILDEHDATKADARQLIQQTTQKFRYVGLIVTLSPRVWLETPPDLTLNIATTRFMSVGAEPGLWPALQSGKALALAGPLDGDIGRIVIDAVVSGLTHSRAGGFTRTVDVELVTRENLVDFARRYAKAARVELSTLWPDAPAAP